MGIRVGGSTITNWRFHVVADNVVSNTRSIASNAFGIYSDGSVAGLFTGNHIVRSQAQNPSFRAYGIRIAGGKDNVVAGNTYIGTGASNDTGISTSSPTDSCHDNHLRAPVATSTCDPAPGNH
jgi:hypothetical protein